MSGKRIIQAPRGSERSCRGWIQEAALRMLMNNLDPDVAEDPDRLVVYGGSGRAARSWQDFDTIVATLRKLGNDETLLVQSGKPVGVLRSHEQAPRVLLANSLLVPKWATWEEFRRLKAMELLPGRPLRHQQAVGEQHPRGLLVRAEHADRLARLHQQRLVVAQLAERGHNRVEILPAPRRPAGAAVDDQAV